LFVWMFALSALFILFSRLGSDFTQSLSPAELEAKINEGKVERITFSPETLKISGSFKRSPDGKLLEARPFFEARAVGANHFESIYKLAVDKKVMVRVEDPPNFFKMQLILTLVSLGGFVLLFMWLARKQGEQMGKFFKSKSRRFKRSDKKKVFNDVAGCDEAKYELEEIVKFLKEPGKFTSVGAKIPKGVLLVGPPGTGKTLLAQAVAGEANVEFLSATGSEFIEMFVGVGASRVRELFEEAKKLAPCIVFIDEIDAIGKKRGVAIGGGHDEREQTLNQILTELDGFTKSTGVVVIAATNRADVLDEALIRPGRFDRKVYVHPPELEGRVQILKIHSRGVKLGPDVDLEYIAKDTVGMVGADLANIVNEAALIATRRDSPVVEAKDFSEAVDKVSMGPERKSTKMSEEEKRMTAYHEAGHTLVAMLNKEADPVHKVTIIPRGPALGFTKQLPSSDRHSQTKEQLLAKVAVCAGGRVAEELVFNKITTGASNDFEHATFILRKMIYELGMDEEVGPVVYKSGTDFWGQPTGLDVSEKTKELLESRVKKQMDAVMKEVSELLGKNRPKLDALAKMLLEKETLNSEEIKNVLQSA
jgi:cell division protease FtsH